MNPHPVFTDLYLTAGSPLRPENTNEDCLICSEPVEAVSETLTHSVCRHSFHAACVERWHATSRRANCPHDNTLLQPRENMETLEYLANLWSRFEGDGEDNAIADGESNPEDLTFGDSPANGEDLIFDEDMDDEDEDMGDEDLDDDLTDMESAVDEEIERIRQLHQNPLPMILTRAESAILRVMGSAFGGQRPGEQGREARVRRMQRRLAAALPTEAIPLYAAQITLAAERLADHEDRNETGMNV